MNVNDPQKELELLLSNRDLAGKSLCLHSCCAPCSSYCMLYLSCFFRITVYFDNPNITEEAEYRKRADELRRLVDAYNRAADPALSDTGYESFDFGQRGEKHPELVTWIREQFSGQRYPITYEEATFDEERFFRMAKGKEDAPERGERCRACYGMRLADTEKFATEMGADFFATTLTLSPLKDAAAINDIGSRLQKPEGAVYLPTDFKKKGGYLCSILLSEMFHLYRQNYCGCIYSRR
ncbi:MAG: epoxyqueuosine reductase QueH [Lachnospiraceae bacterium]|nr:epoxyqueuosine reductase QueH [Lachnospiraceae bacterium]